MKHSITESSNARKPRLLKETVEIALTEIKRFLEPQLMEQLQLRRVSAPLYLAAASPLLQPECRGARIQLASGEEVEIVGALDLWLRSQLKEYDIAPGFGVYTVMNAVRTDVIANRTCSPHVAAWSWQQSATEDTLNPASLRSSARKIYQLLWECERMILDLFPHLNATLSRDMEVITLDELKEMYAAGNMERSIYHALHPVTSDPLPCRTIYMEFPPSYTHNSDCQHDDNQCIASSKMVNPENNSGNNGSRGVVCSGELWAWNRTTWSPLKLADFACRRSDNIAEASIGGNIYRNSLAMQLLHQNTTL